MPEQKNNHFVPVSYLKQWSENTKQILSFLIKQRKSVTATINDETSKDYLYGKDGKIENLFCDLENAIKNIVKDIIESSMSDLKNLSTIDQNRLKAFMSIGIHRTQWQSDFINETADTFIKNFIKSIDPDELGIILPDNWEQDLTIKTSFPKMLINSLPQLFMCSHDLDLILITENNLSNEFITSDNPVVLFNPFAKQLGYSGTGITCSGVIMYMPIAPQLALIAYDKNAYNINRRKISFDDLNIAMACNAINCLYYKKQKLQN